MAILALEPDSARAATIQHIVRDVVRADLRLVRSKGDLLRALSRDIPDLILLPALLSPSDEEEVIAHLSALQDSGHLETLITPFRFAPEAPTVEAPRGWRRWWTRSRPQPVVPACDPRVFAEQLLWSLQRAQRVRQEYAEQVHQQYPDQFHCLEEFQVERAPAVVDVSELPLVTPTVSLAPISDLAIPGLLHSHGSPSPGSDRRAHRRFRADELPGLRTARLTHGPRVKLVDCSEGGALVETDVPLRPESEAVLELATDGQQSVVPFRVVRCQVSVVESRLLYWGACAFTQPLELSNLLRPRASDMAAPAILGPDRFDIAVKSIVERYVSPGGRRVAPSPSLAATEVRELVTSLEEISCARPSDPIGDAVKGLLAAGIAALQHDDERDVMLARIEEQLHALLPWLTVWFSTASMSMTADDREAIYLDVPAAGETGLALNVELPRGLILEDWQFRLLKTSAYLAALLPPAAGAQAYPSVTAGDRYSRPLIDANRIDPDGHRRESTELQFVQPSAV